MGKTIKTIKVLSLVIIIIELLIIAAFCIFYFNNLFDFKNLAKVEYITLSASGLIFFDCVYVWIICLLISSLRQKTDLRAAEVIGSDVQEAYNFAQIGLAVTDDKDTVIWTNDLFKERHIDIIDTNIYAWKDKLLSLKDSAVNDKTEKITVNSRNYEVKYLAQAGLWIFKDVTDYESIYAYSRDNATVLGILAIDNYDDVIRGEDDFNDLVTKVKNAIFTYAKEYGILLRRIKDDNYLMICTHKDYMRMKDNHFSIIDKVREVSSGAEIPLTLSIGIARDFPDVNKLNELAYSALDIAMSRGGDQVVVSVFGHEMEFYGGKSEAQEKRNRVKVRVLADSLISLLKGSSNIVIMGHTQMDMDALGACLGIKAICDHLEKPSQVVVDLKNTETKTRGAILSSFSKDEIEKIIVSSKDAVDLIGPSSLLVVVDVHMPNMTMAPGLLDKCSKVVVIDHHRRAEEYIENPVFNHIDPAASSTSELVAEFIRFSSINPRIEIPSSYATIMLSGIFLDSSYFKSKNTGIRTFEAASILKEYGADNAVADDFLKDDFEEYKVVNDIISHLEHPFYGVVVATANKDKVYDTATISKAANSCLTLKGVHASFVLGKSGSKEVKMSARSDGSINVQKLCEKLGGGGHFSMAAVKFENTTLEDAKEALINVLEAHLNDAKSDERLRKDEEDN